MNYLNRLEESFKQYAEEYSHLSPTKLAFIATELFEFTTYEYEIAELMAKKAIEVCQAVSEGKTFDYIKTEEGHLWYLIMVNMPFFKDKIDWGTSIRGAWWGYYGDIKINGCALTGEFEMSFKDAESWMSFITAVIEFPTEQP